MSTTSRSFIKGLVTFGTIFGATGKKLTGLQDSAASITDTLIITATDTIQLTTTVPEFLTEDRYFRITGGGGANQNQLFRVLSVSGNVIVVDTTVNSVSVYSGVATIDARIASVIGDVTIAKLNDSGNTIFNLDNVSTTLTPEDGSCIASNPADHYHGDTVTLTPPFYLTFSIGDWFSSDAGDTYSIDINHNLDILFPNTQVWDADDGNDTVWLHRTRIIDSNNLRISVSNAGADGRFNGTIRIER